MVTVDKDGELRCANSSMSPDRLGVSLLKTT